MYINNNAMPELPEWLSLYLDKSHGHDELANHSGLNPDHWDTLFKRLASLTADDVSSRATEISQLLQNGNIKNESNKQWHFDPLPFMLSKADWALLEEGIKQRTLLLNKIQQDIYGDQTLLVDGHIPAKQLFQDPNYLREGFSLPSNELTLFFTALDVYRTPTGEFKVLSDHCQCPLGLGLLIKSRIIARRVMAEEFAECNVQQIKEFLNLFQEGINEYTHYMDDPRIVILTQGIDDPNYNEHAFLSTYFGYTLVQSADLTVRGGDVCLKSLQGLGKINVILRWVSDRCIDSLEQTEYSLHGIPGLLQSVRQGSVKVLNPFGSGVLSSPSIKCNLEKLSQQILKQPLLLGEPNYLSVKEAQAVDWNNLELLSAIDPTLKLDGVLDEQEIKLLISKEPDNYFFQEKPSFSSAPFWHDGQLISKPVVFRCYALTTENGVEVLPSALCFSNEKSNNPRISGWIKDTWINTADRVDLGEHNPPVPIRKRMDVTLLEGVISSRTAEHLFWLGRYLERCENTIRILRIFIDKYTEFSVYPDSIRKSIVARLSNAIRSQYIVYPYIEPDLKLDGIDVNLSKETAFQLLADEQCAGSIINTLKYIANASVQIQELLSHDSRRIIDDINEQIKVFKNVNINIPTRAMQSSLDRVIGSIMAFNGSITDCMPNSNGWFLLEMGRRVERSLQITSLSAALLTKELDEPEELGLLEAVLSCQVSLVTHKRRYRMYQTIGTGLELLLLDAEYPRSLLFQLEEINKLCKHLPTKRRQGVIAAHEKAILLSKTSCYVTEKDYLQKSENGQRNQLIEFNHNTRMNLDTFCDVLLLQYFSHTQTANKLNWTNIEQAQS
ncbi:MULTISPECIES: circularly permuted type 2 ATP-grasp protein [Pseudoalteromonas]|uniref:Circularly permuted type 2 ATP-grasp protein n=5 Tax=Gammaproteobacteria TaxID=1236 RepID=A0AAP7CMU9_9GAMM|nr:MULTISPECIES: circularly permuted type 2 ATP-grasp protein [Pseudoalteromonas]MBH0035245.1 circularly permuted type 2 ATP-grasp protein [Pseudoalteromonas sp. NZS71_1]MBH0041928.1 circularly permuted type 2 ATP-grasp protein [Pseudoalteromonas sp. SWXJZ10B]MBH0047861.1 circularly permuted type 2 ATP-grasp protein [Pseudoalteromonas sp. NZS11_1]MBH0048788.1 circularly permuted type 2 ATP-grasp protein [Pseudoalteromonas sp. SWYJZ19]MBH0074552.1 circularly permuted type 2 ATP-grasp protein [P